MQSREHEKQEPGLTLAKSWSLVEPLLHTGAHVQDVSLPAQQAPEGVPVPCTSYCTTQHHNTLASKNNTKKDNHNTLASKNNTKKDNHDTLASKNNTKNNPKANEINDNSMAQQGSLHSSYQADLPEAPK